MSYSYRAASKEGHENIHPRSDHRSHSARQRHHNEGLIDHNTTPHTTRPPVQRPFGNSLYRIVIILKLFKLHEFSERYSLIVVLMGRPDVNMQHHVVRPNLRGASLLPGDNIKETEEQLLAILRGPQRCSSQFGHANNLSCFSSWPLFSRANCSMRSNGTCSASISDRWAFMARTSPSCTR
jgi:hypothetical protein